MKMAPTKVLKVLFVDDDSDESYLFNEALEQSELPIELGRAHDGNQLLQVLQTGSLPDIILVDLNMPYKDGIEALREIRSNPEYEKIFIIIYSITGDKNSIKLAYDIGADLYLIKPEDFDGMLAVVKKVYSIDWQNFKRPDRAEFVLDLNN
ncbi:MAG: response regulator [Chitinophagaceae bacterium]|nr:response regulator [Chitinophagaceae bacterium]